MEGIRHPSEPVFACSTCTLRHNSTRHASTLCLLTDVSAKSRTIAPSVINPAAAESHGIEMRANRRVPVDGSAQRPSVLNLRSMWPDGAFFKQAQLPLDRIVNAAAFPWSEQGTIREAPEPDAHSHEGLPRFRR